MGFATVWTARAVLRQLLPVPRCRAAGCPSCSTAGRETTLGDALRATVGEVPDDTLAGWTAVLADLAGEADATDRSLLADLTPEARKRLVVQALSAVLGARARERPQLVVLDDLHWADPASLEVLEELLALVSDLPVVVLALYRPGWTNPWSHAARTSR